MHLVRSLVHSFIHACMYFHIYTQTHNCCCCKKSNKLLLLLLLYIYIYIHIYIYSTATTKTEHSTFYVYSHSIYVEHTHKQIFRLVHILLQNKRITFTIIRIIIIIFLFIYFLVYLFESYFQLRQQQQIKP